MEFKKAREAKGLTLNEVARISGYGIGTISDFENKGEGSTRLKMALSKIYGLPMPEWSRGQLAKERADGTDQAPVERARCETPASDNIPPNIRAMLDDLQTEFVERIEGIKQQLNSSRPQGVKVPAFRSGKKFS